MTWFKHNCWFCGLKHKDLDYVVNIHTGEYQCKNRVSCNKRFEKLNEGLLIKWAWKNWENIGGIPSSLRRSD